MNSKLSWSRSVDTDIFLILQKLSMKDITERSYSKLDITFHGHNNVMRKYSRMDKCEEGFK